MTQTIKLTGELTFATVKRIHQQQHSAIKNAESVCVDLHAVTHSDSAGLALLVAWAQQAKQGAGHMTFMHPPAQMVAMATVCNLTQILSF